VDDGTSHPDDPDDTWLDELAATQEALEHEREDANAIRAF
jgi:hypothetical protein